MTQTKPITIITTIQPPDAKGKRKLTVAAAPEGEMPAVLTGLFADWHRLEAEAYVAVSTRKPQTVHGKNGGAPKPGKAKTTKKAAKKRTGPIGQKESPEPVEPAGNEARPVEAPEPEPVAEPPAIETDSEEQLPLIEGDNHD